jgi:citrate lyase beta subunit
MEYAQKVKGAYEDGASRGQGAVNLDGVMVDKPVYERALVVLRLMEQIKNSAN